MAYFYPPAGGSGLPAVQRVLRFVRYLKTDETHVLSVKPGLYPEYLKQDCCVALPVGRESIHRTGVVDLLGLVLRSRDWFRKRFGKFKVKGPVQGPEIVTGEGGHQSASQRIKDFISGALNYPDFAGSWLIPSIITGVRLTRAHNIEIVFATGMPWTSLLVGTFIKMFTGCKLVVDFRDPWVENPFFSNGWLHERVDRAAEAFVVRAADLVIANTEPLKKQMVERYRKMQDKVFVLPNGYDVGDFREIPGTELPEEQFSISHGGFLYLKRDPKALLQAIGIIKERHPELSKILRFYQIGDIRLDYDIEAYCRRKDISDNLVLMGQLEHRRCLGHLKASDVLLLIQPETKTQIPSKIFEYIYLGKPIVAIAEKEGALGRLISTYGFGAVFEMGEYHEIAEHLAMLARTKANGEWDVPDYAERERFDARRLISDLKCRLNDI